MTSGLGATARLWIARSALLWGAIGFAHAMARQADTPRGLVLWLLAAPLIALAMTAAGLVFSPLPARWVTGAGLRWRARLVALWLPCGIVYYVAGFLLAPDPDYWNWIFGRLFWPLTIAVMLLATDALAASARSGELWLLAGSIVVALIAGEMAARSWVRYGVKSDWERAQLDPGTTSFLAPRYAPHHYESYIPKPGFVSRDGRNRHNALGFRGGEITQPKPAGVFRIAALGGSTTYDTEVRDWHDAYPAQLEKLLNAGRPDGGVEVVNAGVPGHDTGEILINLEFRVLDLQPDLLIFYENTNDVASRIVPPRLYRGDNSGRRKIWDSEAVARATSPLMRVPSALLRFLAVKLRWFGDGNVVSLDDVVEVPCSGHLVHVSCLGMSVGQALEANPPIYFERHLRGVAAVARGRACRCC